MNRLLLPSTKIIGQGITGSEGSTALRWMLPYGTNIVAGVTPGKGGQEVEGLPVFNSVAEAKNAIPDIQASVVYAPPMFVKAAVIEALEAGITWLLIVTEKVPTSDSAYIYALAKEKGAVIIGPSSAGLISPHQKIKIGSIGGPAPERAYVDGNIAVISKSGSMTSEISLHLKNHGLGVSWAICIGGDRIIGSDYVDLLLELENDPQTKASVIFGELGGTYEEHIAEYVKNSQIKKPVIALISGEFTQKLPNEVQFGHAGAIIEGKRGNPEYKRRVLQDSGAHIPESLDQIAELLSKIGVE